ncbi:MAG: biotin carboxylase N-terminal domain-containing protein [Fimbriimonadaceae bacterium]|nr:biotin carboxylase N-terminal domain-containing protein [Fimbriimonadaceae bacterium]
MIRKILVANRGEIARRVFRTARELGIATVAVYSEADASAPYVREADESALIGPAEASASYLRADVILDVAAHLGVDGIHPGYGFLSERADFSDACRARGMAFIGPSGDAMRKLGTKADAKALARLASVPCVPGVESATGDLAELRDGATKIGYPVMLKASSGGGGRGMRVVHDPAAFDEEFHRASEEAVKSFGDGTMLVEKYVANPRHVEVQFIADGFGNIATLYERECSIQRRHQKLIEEAPAARSVNWDGMREAVRNLVREANYQNAGTAEFIVDPATGEFYFLEVNARLQVEHPVTELITGVDLVAEQIRVASGLTLSIPAELMAGNRSLIHGHAIEIRVVAENAERGFIPSLGKIVGWAEPRHPSVRVDSGFEVGSEVTRHYDSMLAKIIAHGPDRATAVRRLRAALDDFHVLGVETNLGLMREVLDSPSFLAGDLDTGFIGRFLVERTAPPIPGWVANIAAMATSGSAASTEAGPSAHAIAGAWQSDGFRNATSGR